LVNSNVNGFASLAMELRANEKALQTLALTGQQDTEMFKQLQAEIANAQRQLTIFKENEKMNESTAPALQAMTTAAKGLAGAYAVGAGAASMFADGDEKVQKRLNSLIAVMMVLQGLEEINQLLVKKGAIAQIFSAQAAKVLTLAQEAQTAIFGKSTTVKKAEAEANLLLAKTNLANVTATEGVTAAEVAASEAAVVEAESLVAVEGAASAATVAVEGLEAAIIATGIGALVVAAIFLITKLVGVIMDWVGADAKLAKQQKELAENMGALLDTIKKQDDAFVEAAQNKIKLLEAQAEQTKAAGITESAGLALDKSIAEQKKKIWQDVAANHGLSVDQINKNLEKETNIYAKGLSDLEAFQEAHKGDTGTDKEEADKKIELNGKILENHRKAIDMLKSISEGYSDAQKEIDVKNAEAAKLSADELRAYREHSIKLEAQAVIDHNNLIAESDKATFAQRIAISKANLVEQLKILKAENDAKQHDPTLSHTDKLMAAGDYEKAVTKAKEEEVVKRQKLTDDENRRGEEMLTEMLKLQIEAASEADKRIFNNTSESLTNRLAAYKDYYSRQKELLDQKYRFDIERVNGDKTKELLINQQHDAALVALAIKTNDDIYKIQSSKLSTDKADAFSKINTEGVKAETEELKRLDAQLRAGKLSIQEFEKAKKKFDTAQKTNEIDSQIAALEKEKQGYIDLAQAATTGGDKQSATDANKNVDAITGQLADLENRKIKMQEEAATREALKKQEAKQKENELANESFNTAVSIADSMFEKRKMQIEKEIELVEKKRDAEVNAINSSTMNEQQKRSALLITEKQAAEQKAALQKQAKEEDIKKAKFDKAAAILSIAVHTAEAIAGALAAFPETAGMPFTAIDAAIGAVQIAAVAAKPIPQYADGTDFHPGGPAIVGEGAFSELVQTPGGTFIADKTMLLPDLAAGSKVTPINENTINDLMNIALIRSMATGQVIQTDKELRNEIKGLKGVINQQTQTLKEALKAQRPPTVIVKSDSFNDYIRRSVKE